MKTNNLVQGIGVNDASYPVTRYATTNGIRKHVWECPFYRSWKGVLMRCYSNNYQEMDGNTRLGRQAP